jgi:hypothetical protein
LQENEGKRETKKINQKMLGQKAVMGVCPLFNFFSLLCPFSFSSIATSKAEEIKSCFKYAID